MGRSTRRSSQRRLRVAATHPSPGPPAVFLVPPDCPVGDLTAATATAMLATVRPRDVGRAAPAGARGGARYRRHPRRHPDHAVDAQLGEVVAGTGTGTGLTDIKGVGVVMAALILGEVGDVRRFPSNHHATYTGSAPTETSSGEITRHRLSRAGNRRLNHALHVAALSQRPYDDGGKVYYDRKGRRRQGQEGRHAVPQAPAVRRGVPPPRRRREGPPVDRRARGRARHGPLRQLKGGPGFGRSGATL